MLHLIMVSLIALNIGKETPAPGKRKELTERSLRQKVSIGREEISETNKVQNLFKQLYLSKNLQTYGLRCQNGAMVNDSFAYRKTKSCRQHGLYVLGLTF